MRKDMKEKYKFSKEKVRNEIDSRREKLAEEMRSREMKCFENRKEMEIEKRNKLKITKKKIEEKDKKVIFSFSKITND